MNIVLNSDILWSGRLVTERLPRHLEEFARKAQSVNSTLVIPKTALMEYERNQIEAAQKCERDVKSALKLLDGFGIPVAPLVPADYCRPGDLPGLLSTFGVKVRIEEARMEDYREAERRACMHLSPQPPDTKNDEMRDLVIWMMALRLAQQLGPAILVSRDIVHFHERGEAEATASHLLRARELDEALDLMDVESTVGRLARLMLAPAWNALREEGLPLNPVIVLRTIEDPVFIQGVSGPRAARFRFRARSSENGKVEAEAAIEIDELVRVSLSNIKLDGQVWRDGSVRVSVEAPAEDLTASPDDDRLSALRDVLRS